ncbi:hypothetical protein GVV04_09665 [Micromonospora sp. NEAU-HG-1]|nr:hypothetical protein [Micromonospora rubida]
MLCYPATIPLSSRTLNQLAERIRCTTSKQTATQVENGSVVVVVAALALIADAIRPPDQQGRL